MSTNDVLKSADPTLSAFLDANPNLNPATFQYRNPDSLATLAWPGGTDEATRNRTIDRMKGYQRLLKVCPDPDSAAKLLCGAQKPSQVALLQADAQSAPAASLDALHSSHQIAAMSQSHFVNTYGPSLGEDGQAKAAQIHANATHVRTQIMHQWAAMHQIVEPHAQMMAVSNISDETVATVQQMPSYDQLFDSLNYCECDECQSIFGPAAYFVDLMRIATQYITEPNKETIPNGMKLDERRPDLANEIELTCENTNQTMPYLNIVNQRLEAALRPSLASGADLYQTLAAQLYPFGLPFQLPLSRIRIYLNRLKVNLSDVYTAFNDPDNHWAAETLGLSPEEWNILSVSDTSDASLKRYYGVADLTKLTDVVTFCRQTGLKLTDVSALVYQNLSQAEIDGGLTAQFFVNNGAAKPLQIEAHGENGTFVNADNGSWDRIHRFIRLSGRLGWSYDELDWALKCAGGTAVMDEATLTKLASLKKFMDQNGIPLDVACALVFDLRTYGAGHDDSPANVPFDRLFNGSGLATYHPSDEGAAAYKLNPLYKTAPVPWKPNETDDTDQKLSSRIAAGLGIKQDALNALVAAVFPNTSTIALTVSVLSALNRHVLLAARCKLPLPQYAKFIQLFGFARASFGTADVADLLDKASRLRRSKLSVYELDYIVSGTASSYVAIPYREQDVAAWFKALPTLVSSMLTDPEEQVLTQLAKFFNVQTEQMRAITAMLGQDLVSVYLTNPSVEAIKDVARALVLVRKLNLSNDDLNGIQSSPAAYGIDLSKGWTPQNVLDLSALNEAKAAYGDTTGSLNAYMTSTDSGDMANLLADLAAQDASLIQSLLDLFKDPNRIVNLSGMQRILDLISATGADLDYLTNLRDLLTWNATANWSDYQTTAEHTLAVVRARLAAADNWNSLFSQLDGEVQEKKRTAMVGAAIAYMASREETAWIGNTRDLYEYLLIDVEMSGVAQISYIKEALNAVQLYLLRCRERLETGIVHLDIPTVWWEWMMNYRVWEANRKIFLYPENYIDPAYRNSKTQLFKELENTLKQNEITKDTTEAAFKKYLDSFAELAKLKYVDAYYCNVSDDTRADAPTMFLIARTETQPYKYYYIVRESEGTWSEWQNIDISINADTVTPIYAFNKLFLFWIEQKNYDDKQSGNQGSNSQKVSKIGIRYSFYNFSGKWVQPQPLTDDIVYQVDGSAYRASYDKIFPNSFFESSQLWWNKVYPVKIESDRYLTSGVGNNRFEKIVLLYGPMLDLAQSSVDTINAPTSTDTTVLAFENQLYRTLDHLNKAKGYGNSGHLPVFDALVINDDLEVGFLTKSDEFVVLERESPKSMRQLVPDIDRGAGRLNLIQTDETVYDNYYNDQPATPATVALPYKLSSGSFVNADASINIDADFSTKVYTHLVEAKYLQSNGFPSPDLDFNEMETDLRTFLQGETSLDARISYLLLKVFDASGTPWISTAIRDKSFSVSTIKNHPNSFVFKGDKEAILLLDTNANTPTISRALFNADTIFEPDGFVSAGANITNVGSESFYNVLVSSGMLDGEGKLESWADSESIAEALSGQGNQDQLNAVINILMHTTMFAQNSFIAPPPVDIQASGSESIFKELIAEGYLDKNGRLMANIDFYYLMDSLRTMLNGQPNVELKVRYVADILYQYTFPASIGFFDSANAASDISKVKYEAIRLTTAAVHKLSRTLFTGGVDALLSLSSQQIPVESELPFERFQLSGSRVIAPDAKDGAQVDFSGAYGPYYWELFFHAPMYIAGLLKTNQQFQDAEKWYQYIFNPTIPESPLGPDSFQTSTLGPRDSERIYKVLSDQKLITPEGAVSSTFNAETPLNEMLAFLGVKQIDSVRNILLNNQLSKAVARFWQFQPFRNHTLESLQDQLQNPQEIAAYNQDPFDPHAIARLRIGAYEKAVLMQYIDNLLQWGDSLFTQYTWESNVAATMHYVQAQNLLGPKPENLGPCDEPAPETFADIYNQYQGDIPQFFIELEHTADTSSSTMAFCPVNALDTYFTVPGNENFIAYWDKVEDRLFKIRHSLNINGVPQPLLLFEPPIDPNLLVRAAGASGDVMNAIAGGSPHVPYYRFAYMLDRAKNITGVAAQLGASLLAALEKQDAEALAMLRSTHEKNIMNLTTMLKEKQIEENKALGDSLTQSKASAQKRSDHYKALIDEDMNGMEIADLVLRDLALGLQLTAIATNGITIGGYLTPNIFGLADGGFSVGDAIKAGAEMASGGAAALDQVAGMINTKAGYIRRSEDWQLQQDLADFEVKQIQKQIDANQARTDLLQRELEINNKSIEQEQEYEDFLTGKFTNEDLYQWMVGRLSTIYFQTYQLAVQTAYLAQAAYQFEMNRDDTFVGFDYWNSMRRGLLAGESLMLALSQMEKSYMDNNSRYLEIEKTVSLLHLDPVNFLAFKGGIEGKPKGQLSFELSEQLFDFDFPGHYCRQIKSISVTIPAVVGPYQSINATLKQESSTVAVKATSKSIAYMLNPSTDMPDDQSVRTNWVPNQQIALSRGVSDSGMFVLDFKDERYLPFEGTGAVSKWTLSLPPETNRFDFGTITDVFVKIQFTAQDGNPDYCKTVKGLLHSDNPPYPYLPAKLFDLKTAYPREWMNFLATPPQNGAQQITFPLTDTVILPYLKDVKLLSAKIVLATPSGTSVSDKSKDQTFVSIQIGTDPAISVPIADNAGDADLSNSTTYDSGCRLIFNVNAAPSALLKNGAIDPDQLQSIAVVLTYQSNVF